MLDVASCMKLEIKSKGEDIIRFGKNAVIHRGMRVLLLCDTTRVMWSVSSRSRKTI